MNPYIFDGFRLRIVSMWSLRQVKTKQIARLQESSKLNFSRPVVNLNTLLGMGFPEKTAEPSVLLISFKVIRIYIEFWISYLM